MSVQFGDIVHACRWCCCVTVASMINLGVVSLLQHPDQLKALKEVSNSHWLVFNHWHIGNNSKQCI
jgi:hypothetical protein